MSASADSQGCQQEMMMASTAIDASLTTATHLQMKGTTSKVELFVYLHLSVKHRREGENGS